MLMHPIGGRRPITGGNDHLTRLLVASDQANGSTTFKDTSNGGKYGDRHTLAVNGGAVHSNAVAMQGRATSIFLDGAGDYLQAPNHADFNPGDNDFTLDLYLRYASLISPGVLFRGIIGNATGTGSVSTGWTLFQENQTPGNDFVFRFNAGGPQAMASDGTKTSGVNYHIAVERYAGNVKMYVDGVAQTTVINVGTAPLVASSQPLTIGRTLGYDQTLYDFHGYLGEIRWSVGHARWRGNFTPPTTPWKSWE